MRKLTKGFLIFGVVTTIIGFILLFVGIQSDGIKSLLAMSKEPVYDSRMEELSFCEGGGKQKINGRLPVVVNEQIKYGMGIDVPKQK